MKKILKIFFCFFFITSCGYTPIFTASEVEFKISEYELEGDEGLGKRILDTLQRTKKKSPKEVKNLHIYIDVTKNRIDAIKNSAGEVLTYKLDIVVKIKVKYPDSKDWIYAEKLSASISFDNQSQVSDTISLENTTTNNIINKLSNDLVLTLNQFILQK